MNPTSSLLVGFLGLTLLASCSEQATPRTDWSPLQISDLDTAHQAQYSRAEAARTAMFGELMKTLVAEMSSSGPAGSIGVCQDEAPRIAASVSERLGLRIGRTSWKLRNPANAAPAWAEELLANRPAEPRAAAGPEGELGVTLPILVAGPCLQCHGSAASLGADVREALASRYPADQATGFRDGDLRGWFWIEVPPAAR